MFRTIGAFIIFLMAISFVLAIGYIIFAAVTLAGFVFSLISYLGVRNIRPSAMVCPYCGKHHIRIHTLQSASTTDSSGYGSVYPGMISTAHAYGSSSSNTTVHYRHEAECLECGYVWNFVTEDDAYSAVSSARSRLILFTVLLVILGIFTVYLNAEKEEKKEETSSLSASAEEIRFSEAELSGSGSVLIIYSDEDIQMI